MEGMQVPPQPGAPERAHRLLPLGRLGMAALLGGLFCLVATLAFVWLASGVFADRFVTIDDELLLGLHSRASPGLDQIMLLLTTLGDSPVLTLLLAPIGVALLRRGRWIDAGGLLVGGVGAGLLNHLLKISYQRLRPDLFTGPFQLSSYSFPSGHAMGSMVCYGMLAFLAARLLRRPLWRLLVVLGAALLILGVGISRIYFGVHFPTDVIGGYTAGAIWLVVVALGVEAAEWYASRRVRRRQVERV